MLKSEKFFNFSKVCKICPGKKVLQIFFGWIEILKQFVTLFTFPNVKDSNPSIGGAPIQKTTSLTSAKVKNRFYRKTLLQAILKISVK